MRKNKRAKDSQKSETSDRANTQKLSIGLVAPSSVVPQTELQIGLEWLRAQTRWDLRMHPQCKKKHLFFAGSDQDRAEAFFEYANSPDLPVVWCARGGYGASHLLPVLDRLVQERGLPPSGKLLIGSSDATSLLDYVQSRWGWKVLHAPMPGLRSFLAMSAPEWIALRDRVEGKLPARPWGKFAKLKHLGGPLRMEKSELVYSGQIRGGNLSIWASLQGTPWAPRLPASGGTLLFLEDVTETLPRIDRMVEQLIQAGAFEGVRALVLGNFLSCEDAVPRVLKKPSLVAQPKPAQLTPLRKAYSQAQGLKEIFGKGVGDRLGLPVFSGLPVGHGPEKFPLPLGVSAELRISLGGSGNGPTGILVV